MRWIFALSMIVMATFPSIGSSMPDEAAKWLPGARPLSVRRLDIDLDGDDDRIVVAVNKQGGVWAATLCHHPDRWWQPWEQCGHLPVGVANTAPKVERLITGDFDADGRIDVLVEVATADGLHALAIGPALKPHGFAAAPELHLRARGFAVWDIDDDNRSEVVARQPEGATDGPSFVTFTREPAGWRRSHGVSVPPGGTRRWGVPLTRIPDVRGEPLLTAIARLQRAGLRPGMIAAVNEGKGFRHISAQRPVPGDWQSGGGAVDLAAAIPSRPGDVVEAPDPARIVVHGPGGKRVAVKPADLGKWQKEFRLVLGSVGERVRVGGPPLKGPTGVPLAPGETVVEVIFDRALRVRMPGGIIAVTSVMMPFTAYERGLLFLGTPGYDEALAYSASQTLSDWADALTHQSPGGEVQRSASGLAAAPGDPRRSLAGQERAGDVPWRTRAQ